MNYQVGQARVFVGVLAVLVLVAVIAVGLRMYPLSSAEPAVDRFAFVSFPGVFLSVPDADSENDLDYEIYVMNGDGSGVVQLTDNDSFELSPDWSPDGKRIVFTSDRDNDVEIYDIYVMNADGSGVEQLTDGCSDRDPAWSPDGERIAYTSRGDIHVMDADGSDVVQLTGTPRESCAGVFRSRYPDRWDYYYRNADGSVAPEPFTDFESMFDWVVGADWYPVWSPDGGRIAFLSGRSGDGGADIYVMNVDGSGVVRLTDEVPWIDSLSWSPDGGRIAFDAGDIYIVNADGSGLVQLTDTDYEYGGDDNPVWSPDGERIAFNRSGFDSGPPPHNSEDAIYVMNPDGSGLVQLTDNGHDAPVWSPDGRRIAFISDRYGDYGIYVMNADGNGVVERLWDGLWFMPAWSPAVE